MIVFLLMVMLFFMFFSYITEKNFFNPIMFQETLDLVPCINLKI